MGNFHPLEVVDRGSETQLQVGENLNKMGERVRGFFSNLCVKISMSLSFFIFIHCSACFRLILWPPAEACYAGLEPLHATLALAGYLDRRGEHPPISPPHSPIPLSKSKALLYSPLYSAKLCCLTWNWMLSCDLIVLDDPVIWWSRKPHKESHGYR